MKVITCTNFMVGSLIKKKMENCRVGNFLYVAIVVYFMYFECTVVYITIYRDGNVSKKAQNCSVWEFRAILFL